MARARSRSVPAPPCNRVRRALDDAVGWNQPRRPQKTRESGDVDRRYRRPGQIGGVAGGRDPARQGQDSVVAGVPGCGQDVGIVRVGFDHDDVAGAGDVSVAKRFLERRLRHRRRKPDASHARRLEHLDAGDDFEHSPAIARGRVLREQRASRERRDLRRRLRGSGNRDDP